MFIVMVMTLATAPDRLRQCSNARRSEINGGTVHSKEQPAPQHCAADRGNYQQREGAWTMSAPMRHRGAGTHQGDTQDRPPMRSTEDAQKFLAERAEALGLPPIRTTEDVIADSWQSVGDGMRAAMALVDDEMEARNHLPHQ